MPNTRLFAAAAPGRLRAGDPRAPAYRFSCEYSKYVWGKDIFIGDGHQLQVLTSMCYEGDEMVHSYGRLIEWDHFVHGLEQPAPVVVPVEAEEESDSAAEDEVPQQTMADMIFENPWLADRWAEHDQLDEDMSDCEGMKPPSKKEAGIKLDDDRVAAVWAALSAKRMGYAAEELAPQDYFKTSILGGAWTEQHKGVPFDSAMCFSSGGRVVRWCTMFHVQKTKRFGFRGHGEAEAYALARYCAHVMSYYYSVYVDAGGGRRPYTDEELDRRPDASAWLRGKAMTVGKVAESLLAIQDIHPYV